MVYSGQVPSLGNLMHNSNTEKKLAEKWGMKCCTPRLISSTLIQRYKKVYKSNENRTEEVGIWGAFSFHPQDKARAPGQEYRECFSMFEQKT